MDNFLGEIKLFPYNRIPKGWIACNGQIMAASQNQALFALLGTRFGGDGNVTFALPDLRYRTILGSDPQSGFPAGTSVGQEKVTLTNATLPKHSHNAFATSQAADVPQPRPNTMLGEASGTAQNIYGGAAPDMMLKQESLTSVGGGQAHNNMQPSLGLVYCIAIIGVFPSRQ